tara:strand:- start:175 stop:384 length:210 start_codon:yes stop_codon:yes gene_type:complete
MEKIKLEGHRGLVRDRQSGAILNINKEEIEAAKKRKAEKLAKEKEINELKDDVSDMKKMLTKIIEKLDG